MSHFILKSCCSDSLESCVVLRWSKCSTIMCTYNSRTVCKYNEYCQNISATSARGLPCSLSKRASVEYPQLYLKLWNWTAVMHMRRDLFMFFLFAVHYQRLGFNDKCKECFPLNETGCSEKRERDKAALLPARKAPVLYFKYTF